jgi:nickel-type superoxide dismutase maturation protease
MLPGLQAGDRLLVGPALRLRPGHIVAVLDPRPGRRLLVKRVYAVRGDGVEVRGDNPGASTDSREFGPIQWRDVRGRVYYRYAPPERAGWWPSQRE